MSEHISRPRKAYPTDLTDEQWKIIKVLLPLAKPGGRPRKVDLREVVNAILYLNRSGCQWDMLPRELPPKSTVYEYFSQWRDDGSWVKVMSALREQIRITEGREATPSAVCIDSQSTKTTEIGGDDRGYDGAKKVKGRKRHLLVDTLGLLMFVVVTAANLDDGTTAPQVLTKATREAFPRLKIIFGDNKYKNHCLDKWLATERPGWQMEIQSRPAGEPLFKPVRKRWVVERTNAWIGRSRRNSKDYERFTESSEAMILISSCHLMLRRLTPSPGRAKFNYRQEAA